MTTNDDSSEANFGNAYDDAETTDEPQWRHPALALLFAAFCILTIAGNCLVVIAVCTKKYLRNPTGYLIVSLAFADLIVGLIVMPLNSLFEMTQHVWMLGLGLATCDLFHALDILASTSSIWNLCVISLDRYMAGRDPIGYRDKVSTRRITLAICFVWVMSACLSFPAIIWWRKSSPHLYRDHLHSKKVNSDSCASDENIPTLRIHWGKSCVTSDGRTSSSASCKSLVETRGTDDRYSNVGPLDCSQSPLLRPESNVSFNTSGVFRHRPNGTTSSGSHQRSSGIDRTASMITVIPYDERTPESTSTTQAHVARKKLGVREKSRQMMRYVHEQRAARTLSIVVGVFIVCWMPFFIFSPIMTLCETCISSHELVFSIITWAGHLNSMLNPLIYSRFSREFRRAFKQILTCERERRIKTAIRTPLGIVFAQLVSITQLWEQQPNDCASSAVIE
ncbi:unnamed protein product [Toxocara canis]|uniref:G_PROTEIN_RECEP_F1_2 domain-containing protein n=1 Tax=Toxocara canis TaxID=6265 RepID=A0A183UGY7_TOXCA|nr:unnamed protein product [Toxocara canis]